MKILLSYFHPKPHSHIHTVQHLHAFIPHCNQDGIGTQKECIQKKKKKKKESSYLI
jgi:hypothetical protein